MSAQVRVSEIYETIQGESLAAGLPCLMIRLTGCPMRCRWCDSAFAFTGGAMMNIDAIVERVQQSKTPIVEITGGEPLAQKYCLVLIEQILKAWRTTGIQRRLLLETTAFFDLSDVPEEVTKIIDIKCPASGETRANKLEHLRKLTSEDQFKFVVANRDDFDWALQFIKTQSWIWDHTVIFSPVFSDLNPAKLADWVVQEIPQARMQLQLHKFIWPGVEQGV